VVLSMYACIYVYTYSSLNVCMCERALYLDTKASLLRCRRCVCAGMFPMFVSVEFHVSPVLFLHFPAHTLRYLARGAACMTRWSIP
jgi:hypothetical protein